MYYQVHVHVKHPQPAPVMVLKRDLKRDRGSRFRETMKRDRTGSRFSET